MKIKWKGKIHSIDPNKGRKRRKKGTKIRQDK